MTPEMFLITALLAAMPHEMREAVERKLIKLHCEVQGDEVLKDDSLLAVGALLLGKRL